MLRRSVGKVLAPTTNRFDVDAVWMHACNLNASGKSIPIVIYHSLSQHGCLDPVFLDGLFGTIDKTRF
jgi:hypothetical protein